MSGFCESVGGSMTPPLGGAAICATGASLSPIRSNVIATGSLAGGTTAAGAGCSTGAAGAAVVFVGAGTLAVDDGVAVAVVRGAMVGNTDAVGDGVTSGLAVVTWGAAVDTGEPDDSSATPATAVNTAKQAMRIITRR